MYESQIGNICNGSSLRVLTCPFMQTVNIHPISIMFELLFIRPSGAPDHLFPTNMYVFVCIRCVRPKYYDYFI